LRLTPRWRGFGIALLGTESLSRPSESRRTLMDMESLLVFILLPLLVIATAVTFLLIQRARRKRDLGE
jgi:hypothetical protein